MNVFDILREKLEELPIEKKTKFDECVCGWIKETDILFVEKDAVKEISNQVEQEYNSGWIPADNPPKDDSYVLLSFANFTVPLVGRYEEDDGGGAYYVGDEDETLSSQGIFVNAWQPLPAPFREDMQQVKQTNGDKIRAMSNKELTKVIMCPYDTAGEPMDIMPCVTELGTQELVSPESCKQCMMKWLEREVK